MNDRNDNAQKLWGGVFEGTLDSLAEQFNDSLPFDKAMFREDITASIAHARMLGERNIIARAEAESICAALNAIRRDIEDGRLEVKDAEDIHSFVEAELVGRVGDCGKKLHTARSRNDQVATDLRLYVRRCIDETAELLKKLADVLTRRAKAEINTVMPAYTHMQKAQPTTLAHYLCAYAFMFLRDAERFKDCRKRVNVLPLGSGAAVSTTFPIDREAVAKELGFDGVTDNSLDGVSDRDFVIEYLSCASLVAMHLSRINEEFVYWSSGEFAYISLPDEFSTGSSIMPQKRNPDVNELLRGKAGRIFGDLVSMLTVMKGLPLAYNKDMQEDKEPVFDAHKTLSISLEVFTEMLEKVQFDRDRLAAAAEGGFSCATEVADYLAERGTPFRTAHTLTGNIVRYCIKNGTTLQKMTLEEYKSFSPAFDNTVYDAVSAATAVRRRTVPGGCAPKEVERQLQRLYELAEKL